MAATRTRIGVVGALDGTLAMLAQIGDFGSFVLRALAGTRIAVSRYPRVVVSQLNEIVWGRGAIVVGGGTVVITIMLSVSGGAALGIEGHMGLALVGLAPFQGSLSAIANTRELVPLLAALALGTQIGCRFTAEIGAMRINEEVDAMEVMAIDPMHYLVATRLVAISLAVLPLYLISLIGSYVTSYLTVILLYDTSAGQYGHYFALLIQERDVWYSVIKIVVFAVTLGLVHTWYGMRVSGGPASVGEATGRAIRASIVGVVVLDMLMTLIMWGGNAGFRLSG